MTRLLTGTALLCSIPTSRGEYGLRIVFHSSPSMTQHSPFLRRNPQLPASRPSSSPHKTRSWLLSRRRDGRVIRPRVPCYVQVRRFWRTNCCTCILVAIIEDRLIVYAVDYVMYVQNISRKRRTVV
ncbi:hypothetical protein BD310DRAFT_929103 [Dichomitus squalens]|uniref:Uncharacterized protein n=1 Tax=Dichomitus squalens TaxID=114155 RepID=A0A4Q9PT96_9APHY|nr:hypothetical protein BD310DRAFT_929103 [Dichomitus squalens]